MDISPTIQHLHGRIRSITGADPAAGNEILITVPPRRRWRLLSLFFNFITDATVAGRIVRLTIKDNSYNLFYSPAITAQNASLTHSYTFSQVPPTEILAANIRIYSMPPLLLTASFTITTFTANIQAGDNFGAPQLLVEEWIDP